MFVAALLLHGIAFLGVEGALWVGWPDRPLPTSESFLEVSLEPEAPTAEEEEDEELQQQLVKNDRIVDERPNEKAKKISEHDNRVEHETTAPLQRPRPAGNPAPSGDDGERGNNERSGPVTPKGETSPDPSEAKDSDSGSATPLPLHESPRGMESAAGGKASPTGKAGLVGSTKALNQTFGARGSMDRVEGADPGQESILDTARNKYASFFNRVRDAVSDEWAPEPLHKANDPYGNVYGSTDRHTRLLIVLRPDGGLEQVKILKRSGVGYLDEEAVRAVRAAAPFINPPPQLVDAQTGLIEFTFDFFLMIDGSKKIYRHR